MKTYTFINCKFQRVLIIFIKKLVVCFLFILSGQAIFAQCPEALGLSGNFSYCPNSEGAELSLFYTELDVSYVIKKNGNVVRGPLEGNGGSQSFGFGFTTGKYILVATNKISNCTRELDSVTVSEIPTPEEQELIGGGAICPNGNGLQLSLVNSEIGVTYELLNNNISVPTIEGTNGQISFDVVNYLGSYSVKATRNGCAEITFGNQIIISLKPQGLDTTEVTSSTVKFKWNSVEGASGYKYQVSTDAIPSSENLETSDSTAFFEGLTDNNTTYYIHVRAILFSGGDCEWSTIEFKTHSCTAFAPGSFSPFGSGIFCPEQEIEIGMSDTKPDQFYSLVKNGKKTGGRLPGDGNGNGVSFKFTFASQDAVGIYSVISTKEGCDDVESGHVEIILPSPPKGLAVKEVAAKSAKFIWNKITDDFEINSYEYIADTSLLPPESGANAGVTSDTATTVDTLIPLTTYYFHVRGKKNVFSDCQWTTIKFTTAFDCDSAIKVIECAEVTADIPSGEGLWNFEGAYPKNSVNYSTPGKEAIFSFTPSSTGVYYLQVISSTANSYVDYLYKPSSAGCDNANWIGINDCNGPGKIAIGMLNSGVQYSLILDNEGTSAVTQTFKICKAIIAVDSTMLNNCQGFFTTSEPIPAKSPKEEYIIDNDGHLIASLDFSAVSNSVGYAFVDYYVNSNALRKDNTKKEYLDRNITIRTDSAPKVPVKIKFYFKNDELQRLIDEPDDGLADVTGINDLNVTKTQQLCSDVAEDQVPLLLQQSGNGSYDENSSYVQFYTPDFYSTFYIHGGLAALFQDNDTSLVCPGGSTTFVIAALGQDYSYQWQVNPGSGFVNITANSNYSGVNNTILYLTNAPSAFYGYGYRCIATKNNTTVISKIKTLKFEVTWNGAQSSDWGTGSNWTCGVTPDENTDVIIPAGVTNNPIINGNSACRRVFVKTNALLKVESGFMLNIKKN